MSGNSTSVLVYALAVGAYGLLTLLILFLALKEPRRPEAGYATGEDFGRAPVRRADPAVGGARQEVELDPAPRGAGADATASP